MHPGVPDEAKYQLLARTLELKRELNSSAIKGIVSAAPSDTVYATMRGLREYLQASGGNSVTTAEALSERVVNTMYRDAFDDGGDPESFVGGPSQVTKFAGFNSAKMRFGPSDRVAGVFVNRFLTEQGRELSIIQDRWFQRDEAALIERARCYIAPLKGGELGVEPLAKIGSAMRWQVTMWATLVVQNATLAHAYHSNLTV